ncbi:MAG: hypothetical protein WC384_13660 [Prolixibacteraceae bacterium]|jgi:hypothetical protein
MKTLKFLAFALIVIFAASCQKTEQATGAGDVILVAKKSGDNTVYGLSFYAYTFSSFQAVTVANASDATETFTLKANQGYKTNFYYEQPDASYTTTKPGAATYNFSATFTNGVTDEFQDVLSDEFLEVPTIDSCAYSIADQILVTKWELLSNADSYVAMILDDSDVVFSTTELSSVSKNYSVSADGSGWASGFTPVTGKTYTFRLLAFLYEPSGDAYNVQATSVADTTFVWGESNL